MISNITGFNSIKPAQEVREADLGLEGRDQLKQMKKNKTKHFLLLKVSSKFRLLFLQNWSSTFRWSAGQCFGDQLPLTGSRYQLSCLQDLSNDHLDFWQMVNFIWLSCCLSTFTAIPQTHGCHFKKHLFCSFSQIFQIQRFHISVAFHNAHMKGKKNIFIPFMQFISLVLDLKSPLNEIPLSLPASSCHAARGVCNLTPASSSRQLLRRRDRMTA